MIADTRRAAVAVADRAHDADDLRRLLAMLGLVEPTPKRRPAQKPRPNRQGGRGRPPVDHGHGDHRTYTKGCRCADCREAHRMWSADRRAARKLDPEAADRAGHGKPSTYKNYGCRCARCSKANTADVNEFRARRRERKALAETGGAR